MRSNLAIFEPNNMATALLAKLQGIAPDADPTVTVGLDAELREAMEEDFEGIAPQLPILNGLGNAGCFEDKDTKKRYPELKGIMLGKLDGQALFTPTEDDQSEWAQNERAFWGALDGPICRTGDKNVPPVMHPSLGEQQKAELMQRRAGATSCKTCPMARTTQNAQGGWDAPECNGSFRLLWWDSVLEDYCWVRVGGKSIPSFRAAFKALQRRGAALQFPARIYWESVEDGHRKYCVAHIEFGPTKFPDTVTSFLIGKRKQLLHHGADQDHHQEPSQPTQEAAPAAQPAARHSAPAQPTQEAPRGRGTRLSPDGQAVLPTDPAPAPAAAPPAQPAPPATEADADFKSLADQMNGW